MTSAMLAQIVWWILFIDLGEQLRAPLDGGSRESANGAEDFDCELSSMI